MPKSFPNHYPVNGQLNNLTPLVFTDHYQGSGKECNNCRSCSCITPTSIPAKM